MLYPLGEAFFTLSSSHQILRPRISLYKYRMLCRSHIEVIQPRSNEGDIRIWQRNHSHSFEVLPYIWRCINELYFSQKSSARCLFYYIYGKWQSRNTLNFVFLQCIHYYYCVQGFTDLWKNPELPLKNLHHSFDDNLDLYFLSSWKYLLSNSISPRKEINI